jgi:hypothetical protein
MKKPPKKASPSPITAGQSRRIGQRTDSASATGSTTRKPMPQRRIASVIGSADWPTRKRVMAAAEPPSELDTIAISTPARSFTPAPWWCDSPPDGRSAAARQLRGG